MPALIDPESLKGIPLFQGFTDQEFSTATSLFFEKVYSKNSTLFVEGMTGEILYVIKKGSVQILKKVGGQEILLATLKDGEFLGEMTFIDNRPRTATGRVGEDSTLLVMTKKSFNLMMEKHPAMALKVLLCFLRIANDRLSKANQAAK